MKKTIIFALALVSFLPLRSQETEGSDFTSLSLVSRLEANPSFSKAGGAAFDHGSSSLYSLFEGKKGRLGWTLSTHFLQSGGDYAWPYKSLGLSNTTNFLDILNLSLSAGPFKLSAGKQLILNGGIENEDWDWDVSTLLTTELWNGLPCYQWGGSLAISLTKRTSLAVQVSSSPFGEHPFEDGLKVHSFQFRGGYRFFDMVWSASAMQAPDNKSDLLVCLGQTLRPTDFLDITFDWNNNFAVLDDQLLNGSTFNTKVACSLNDKMQICASALYTKTTSKGFDEILKGGLTFNWTPSDDLRVHLIAARDHTLKSYHFSLGARYYLRILK